LWATENLISFIETGGAELAQAVHDGTQTLGSEPNSVYRCALIWLCWAELGSDPKSATAAGLVTFRIPAWKGMTGRMML